MKAKSSKLKAQSANLQLKTNDMTKVSINQIKKLRDLTGAGIMVVRNALQEAEGDFKKAEKILKQKGLAKAEKKSERETKAGKVASYVHTAGRVGVLVALGCETDFVARTEDFTKLAHELCLQVASMNPKDIKVLLAQEYIRDPKITIEELVKQTIGKLGENIKILELERVEV